LHADASTRPYCIQLCRKNEEAKKWARKRWMVRKNPKTRLVTDRKIRVDSFEWVLVTCLHYVDFNADKSSLTMVTTASISHPLKVNLRIYLFAFFRKIAGSVMHGSREA